MQRLTPEGFTHEGFGFEQTVLSPDGQFVAIYNQRVGTWLLKLDDQTKFQVSASGVYPVWAPDSRAIVYYESGKLYVRQFEHWDGPRFIASGFYPAWSPDGRWIAFYTATAIEGQAVQIRHLHLIHPDGTGLHELDSFQVGNRGGASIELRWSHDGRYLLAWGNPPQAARLWQIADSDYRLTLFTAINMATSPTGPFVVLDEHQQLRIIRLAQRLTEYSLMECSWGSWAFDGNRMACLGSDSNLKPVLVMVDLETAQVTNVSVDIPDFYTIKWLPATNFVLVSISYEVPMIDDSGDIWLVNVGSPEPSHLVAKGVPIAVVMTK